MQRLKFIKLESKCMQTQEQSSTVVTTVIIVRTAAQAKLEG